MPVALVAAGVAAAGSVAGAAISSKASKKATNRAVASQEAVAAQNNALQRDQYQQNAARLDPYQQQGLQASGAINALLGFGDPTQANQAFDRYRGSSGYDFRMNQGMNALASNYRGRGISQSGAADKALLRYGQDYGSNEFGRYMGYLGNQQGVGLSAASALAGVGQNYANNVSANNQNAANAMSNAALVNGQNQANAYGTAFNALGNLAGQALGSSFGQNQSNAIGSWANSNAMFKLPPPLSTTSYTAANGFGF